MRPPVVVKVGGSLLDWELLPARLGDFLDQWRNDRLVIICGGGAIVESIRQLDRIHHLGEEQSHQLALGALELSGRILTQIVVGLERVENLAALSACWNRGVIPVLSCQSFLLDDEKSVDALPHHWSVTSDSIAARLAARLGSTTLILLKSAPLVAAIDRLEASDWGLVDAEFARVALPVKEVYYVNLRDFRPELRQLP